MSQKPQFGNFPWSYYYIRRLYPFLLDKNKMKRKSQSTQHNKSKKSKFIQNEATESKDSNSKSKETKKRERNRFVMITARACRYCRVQFKCGHELQKEAEDCSECNLKQ